uniref:Uncharacterized protein n=1 Tax=Cucumis sativus TaxID=3659 RepID=A0A0A0KPM8_CUCSA
MNISLFFTGLCNSKLVTRPVAPHATPSQSPLQQSIPVHDARISVVSCTILALMLNNEALSSSAQTGATVVVVVSATDIASKTSQKQRKSNTHLRNCIFEKMGCNQIRQFW